MIKKYFHNANFFKEKNINNLLNSNYFYFTLTIISLIFSIFINSNIGSFLVSFFISLWIILKNNNTKLLRIIILISTIVLLYYFTGIIYCEGDDTDISNTSGDNNETNIDNNAKPVILESKDYYHINKEDFNKGVSMINQGIKTGFESVIPNLGPGTAAAGAAGSIIKNSNLPTLPKLALAGLGAAIVGGSTKIGLVTADALVKSVSSKETSEKVSDTGNETQSPVNDFIHSVLEKGDMLTPLEELLRCQLGLNVLILLGIFILIMILYNKLFINNGFNLFSKLFNMSFWPTYIKVRVENIKSLSNKVNSFNDKFFYILFIIISLTLIFDILLNIYIISELNTNLQVYIDDYNQIKNK